MASSAGGRLRRQPREFYQELIADLLVYAEERFRADDDQQSEDEPPPRLVYLLDWFNSISDNRESGFGIGPLTHQEIEAWAWLMQVADLSPTEVSVLKMLDRVFRRVMTDKTNPDKTVSGTPESNTLADGLRDLADVAKARRRKKLDG